MTHDSLLADGPRAPPCTAQAVTVEGQTNTTVYLPAGTLWYPHQDALQHMAPLAAPRGGGYVTVHSPVDTIPAFQRAGSVVPLKKRLRRCSGLMRSDPLTLRVALDPVTGAADGSVYVDDEESFACVASGDGRIARSATVATWTVYPF